MPCGRTPPGHRPGEAEGPHDARGEPRDLRWIEAGGKAQLIALGSVQARMRDTRFLDDEEQARALRLLAQHRQA